MTTRFTDVVATSERGPDGRLSSRVTDSAGNLLLTLRVPHASGAGGAIEFALSGGPARHAARREGLQPTLDWANRQAYGLWKDRGALLAGLEWQDDMLRPRGAPRRHRDEGAVAMETVWTGGLAATVTGKIGTHEVDGRKVTGPVFISAFYRDGIEIGFSQWWPDEEAFAWSMPGLTEGFIDAARLALVGGWTFAPDMAWLNTQNLAFYEFHSALAARGSISRRSAGWLERVGAWVMPTLQANEPGCDYLHWLDGSIWRPCCDDHDRCYARQEPACGAYSWWWWWLDWHCTQCNTWAVVCFATGSGSRALHRFP